MKELTDGAQVLSRVYYYLLDFNESDNWSFIRDNFGKTMLKDLAIDEFTKLFEYASESDKTTFIK